MEALKEWLAPYIISNIICAASIVLAVKKPMWIRIFFAAFFFYASLLNSFTAITSPETYLHYAALGAMPLYQKFIRGYFSEHITPIVLSIAIGQFLVFFGLLLKTTWVKMACAGGILFGLAILPLGVGSAFPATLTMAIAFYILYRREQHDYIWHWSQYTAPTGVQENKAAAAPQVEAEPKRQGHLDNV